MPQEQGVANAITLKDALVEAGSAPLHQGAFKVVAKAAFRGRKSRQELQEVLRGWDKLAAEFEARSNASALEGYCHYLLGNLKAAEEIFSKDGKNPWSVYLHIRSLLGRGRLEDALSAVEAAYKKHQDFAPLAFLAIEVYCRNSWEDHVPNILKSLKAASGDSADYAYHEGLYQEKTSEYAAAIASYRRAASIDPTHTDAWFRLGFCLDLRGDGSDETLDQAIAAYERCLKLTPPHTNAVINLACLYEDRERYHDAVKCYEMVLRYYPNHARARLFLEDAYAATNMFYDRDEEKKADRQSQVLKIPVSDFELSVRSRNCLQKMDIMTLGDLIMKTEQELLSYKNFGETSLKEIKDMLSTKCLRLGQGLEQKNADMHSPRNPLEASADPESLDLPVDELNLSVRSRRCMERLGVKSVRDLINMTEVQLMAAKNFGMTSLNEIKRKLAEKNLKLRG